MSVYMRRGGSGGGAGSSFINGIINSYKVASGESVSAGDFVEFVSAGKSDLLTVQSDFTGSINSTIAINDTDVLVSYGSDLGTSSYLVVIRVKDNTITKGNAVYVTDSRVIDHLVKTTSGYIMAFSYVSNPTYGYISQRYASIITISGMTVTIGTSTSLSTSTSSWLVPIACDNDNIMLFYQSGGSYSSGIFYPQAAYKLAIIKATSSGFTTVVSAYAVSISEDIARGVVYQDLGDGRVLILPKSSSNYKMRILKCYNNSITVGDVVDSSPVSSNYRFIKLNDTQLVAISGLTSASIVECNDVTPSILFTSATNLANIMSTTSLSASNFCYKLNANTVVAIALQSGGSSNGSSGTHTYTPYEITFKVSFEENLITATAADPMCDTVSISWSNITGAGGNFSIVGFEFLEDSCVTLFYYTSQSSYGSSSSLRGIVSNPNPLVKSFDGTISGVALEEGTAGDFINVCEPV